MEEWKPIVGWEDSYEISDEGRARSLPRSIEVARGDTTFVRVLKGKILSPGKYESGHLYVNLHRDGVPYPRRIHHLVLEAFVSPRPEGLMGLHWDDDPTHNRLSNLYWGSHSENQYDKVRNGNHHNANKTHCPYEHEYTPENTRVVDGRRYCVTCVRKRNREAEAARRKKNQGVATR